ncbi:nucleoside diphosphate-linked moiety X motif 8-like isoform X5 [Dendronephthya gigantea]|nr:nucleoside diphosphate-linked moiety X motif 8-like isoform X5 [Dendronephthya gigantea]XP_028394063.1 nucleoside diphosphate-linked moiety X motif 8-like isoform X5 [Dendronephthya gigantea]XP_028394064.1 nucleoside diphosphate-linked moiety X motif 8-like isoform X5 [Dendronephthya gigantea]
MVKLSSRQQVLNERATLAGVLVPFCKVNGKPSILFTKRSHKIVRNKSDVCFPGGKMDKDVDKNVVETALRETVEEIGVSKSDIHVWIQIRPIIATNDAAINIVPVFGFIQNLDISKLIIDHNEVTSVFTATLEDLCDPNRHAYTKFRNGSVLPLFFQEPYKIWGFTAVILDLCLSNLLPNIYFPRFIPKKPKGI